MFVGKIPPNLSRLSGLHILDLANNNLSGMIPPSFGNTTAMKSTRQDEDLFLSTLGNATSYKESLDVMMKGNLLEYDKLLSLVMVMNISGNKLYGEIPRELRKLSGLLGLNLAGNNLTGELP